MFIPKLLIFASGAAGGPPGQDGGSGFSELVDWSRKNPDSFEVIGVVSNHEHGGVRRRADASGIPFIYFSPDSPNASYSSVLQNTRISADYYALSGWMKKTHGLDPQKTINIHPALLSQLKGRFGGAGMYGIKIHEAVKEAFEKGEISHTGVSIHFVTETYDGGPVFFEYPVPLEKGMTPIEIRDRVNTAEHEWQPKITNMVVHGEISWDGKDPKSLKVPKGYEFLPKRN